MARPRLVALTAIALLAGACGDVAYDGNNPAQQDRCATAGGDQGTPDELSDLLANLLAPRICEQVVGSFIGLPGEETHEGPAAGLDPSVGRWWIRQCNADARDGRLRVAINGSGWTWLDRESMGFRVRQYLRFDASATFAASLHVGYDARTRIATVWLRPAPGVQARVQPQGLVRAEATGIFSSVLGGILDLTGNSASNTARAQASDEGSARLRDRLATGFTVTYDLGTEQMDFMLGQLARGQTPQRPWPSARGTWIVNERSTVWPNGMDVVGPLPEELGAATLDVELEEGQGAIVRRVCADELGRWLEAAWNGSARSGPPGQAVIELRAAHAPRAVTLAPLLCRSHLLVTPIAQASLPVMLRYRVTEIEAVGAVAAATDPSQTTASGFGSVRVEVRSASIAAHATDGSTWDAMGGEPDPYLVVSAHGRELDRSPIANDTREVRFNRALPAAVRLSEFPIRFVVYDEDVTTDDVIGVADVQASALQPSAVDLLLDLRSEGQNPVQTGTLRVRMTPVP